MRLGCRHGLPACTTLPLLPRRLEAIATEPLHAHGAASATETATACESWNKRQGRNDHDDSVKILAIATAIAIARNRKATESLLTATAVNLPLYRCCSPGALPAGVWSRLAQAPPVATGQRRGRWSVAGSPGNLTLRRGRRPDPLPRPCPRSKARGKRKPETHGN